MNVSSTVYVIYIGLLIIVNQLCCSFVNYRVDENLDCLIKLVYLDIIEISFCVTYSSTRGIHECYIYIYTVIMYINILCYILYILRYIYYIYYAVILQTQG